ncbi:MAG: hypothetical protein M3R70_11265 [Actinomycetota bacterium]|nr:hypothetical protein [Actinomycetota bacterium]
MKRVGLLLVLVAVGLTASANPAATRSRAANPCALPRQQPVWIDFADGSVPFWRLFAQPGVVAASSNFIFPPQLRAYGAKTVYWDMHLVYRVGTPSEPADPGAVVERAHRIYEFASNSMDCAKPMIVENELNGAGTISPWSPTNGRYRADVLLYLQTLASHGARPVILVSSKPYTGGEAGVWWREVAKVADIVREVYFPAPQLWKRGPVDMSRFLRVTFRAALLDFVRIGIPRGRIGIMLGFHTAPGFGGRENLRPAARWFEVIKLQTLAAREVARESKIGTIWSWGWGVWSEPEDDPDKPAAACVWLWTRDAKLCDGPKAAGPAFNSSRTEGQLILPEGARCTVGSRRLAWSDVTGLTRVVGDGQAAFTAAYARAVARGYAQVKPKRVLAAERAVIALRFRGSRRAYRAALARAGAGIAAARAVIADELRRMTIESRLRVASPTSSGVEAYYDAYASMPARLVRVTPAAPWLGGHKRGFALGSVAPPAVFKLKRGRTAVVRTMLGTYRVKALGPVMPLGHFPLQIVRGAISSAIVMLEREEAYQSWLLVHEQANLRITTCWRDQLPAVDAVSPTDYLPFLAVDTGSPATQAPRR